MRNEMQFTFLFYLTRTLNHHHDGVERIGFRVCSFSFLSIAVSGLLGFIFHLPLRTLTYLFTL